MPHCQSLPRTESVRPEMRLVSLRCTTDRILCPTTLQHHKLGLRGAGSPPAVTRAPPPHRQPHRASHTDVVRFRKSKRSQQRERRCKFVSISNRSMCRTSARFKVVFKRAVMEAPRLQPHAGAVAALLPALCIFK